MVPDVELQHVVISTLPKTNNIFALKNRPGRIPQKIQPDRPSLGKTIFEVRTWLLVFGEEYAAVLIGWMHFKLGPP